MRTIKTYFKRAPFYNAFLRTWLVCVVARKQSPRRRKDSALTNPAGALNTEAIKYGLWAVWQVKTKIPEINEEEIQENSGGGARHADGR